MQITVRNLLSPTNNHNHANWWRFHCNKEEVEYVSIAPAIVTDKSIQNVGDSIKATHGKDRWSTQKEAKCQSWIPS